MIKKQYIILIVLLTFFSMTQIALAKAVVGVVTSGTTANDKMIRDGKEIKLEGQMKLYANDEIISTNISDLKIEWFPNVTKKIDGNHMKIIYEKPKRSGGLFGFLGDFFKHIGASKKPTGMREWSDHRGTDDAEMILPGFNATVLPNEVVNFAWGGVEGGKEIVFTNEAGKEVFRKSLNGNNWIDMTPQEFGLTYGEVYSWKIEGLNMAESYKVRLLDNEKAQDILCDLNNIDADKDIEKAAYLQMVSDTFPDDVDLYWLSYKYLKQSAKKNIKGDNFQRLWDRYQGHVTDNE